MYQRETDNVTNITMQKCAYFMARIVYLMMPLYMNEVNTYTKWFSYEMMNKLYHCKNF